MTLTTEESEMAKKWFGYGRWEAPYWFIGLEPGGSELDACVEAWLKYGKPELLDLKDGHSGHELDWFSSSAGPQPTWQKLIWLLLGLKGKEATPDATRRYQKDKLGCRDGETALLELSAIPAENNGVPTERELFRNERITTLRERVLKHHPDLVVFYSPDPNYRNAWNQIAGQRLERGLPVMASGTTFVVTYHPNGRWDKSYWMSVGELLRDKTKT